MLVDTGTTSYAVGYNAVCTVWCGMQNQNTETCRMKFRGQTLTSTGTRGPSNPPYSIPSQAIKMLVPVLLQRLDATFGQIVQSGADRQEQSTTQGLLCGALQVCTLRHPDPNDPSTPPGLRLSAVTRSFV